MDQQDAQYRLFESIFRQHYEQLARYAYTILRNQADAEDVVQEVFARIWNTNRNVLTMDQPGFYLATSVKNASISFLRKQAGKQFLPVENIPVAAGEADPAEEKDLVAIAQKALAQLPPQCLVVFKLSRFGKLTYQQIAEELGISVKTVENQMGKAIRMMREFAKKHEVSFIWAIIFLVNILKNMAG
jgi:RNA polymerase sigma-70 factor (ECF subfamily)